MKTYTKTLLLLSFSALVNSSFGWSVNIMCDRVEFNETACSQTLDVGGTITADHQILGALHSCTLEESAESFQFERESFEESTDIADITRNLRGGEERDLGECDQCYCHEACCLLGYCASSCSCTCACERRRMSAEQEIVDILGGRRLTSVFVQQNIEAKCTTLIKLLAQEHAALGNHCLGTPSSIYCHATLIDA
jgi:hypothetical protein